MCTCTEKATGLKLAAKVIKKQTPKDKVAGRCSQLPIVLGWDPGVKSLWHSRCHTEREKDGQTACNGSLVALAINHTSHFSGDSPF